MPIRGSTEFDILEEFLQHWCTLSVDNKIPRRTAVDPLVLAEIGILSCIWLVERTGGTYRYQLAGEQIINTFGVVPRDKTVEELFHRETAAILKDRWDRALDGEATCHNHGTVGGPHGRTYFGERVALPLLDEHDKPAFVIGATIYREIRSVSKKGADVIAIQSEDAHYTPYMEVLASFRGGAS